MSQFCLIHGSTQNSDCWNLLVPELKSLGHQTIKVDLPTGRNISGMQYAQTIVRELDVVDEDIILVGHSVSGIFLPLVASLRQVHHLVYLASFIPKPGTSIVEQMFDESFDMFESSWAEAWVTATQMGKNLVEDDELALNFLFHDCTPEVAKWALSIRRLLHPEAALSEVFPLQNYPSKGSHSYVICTEDRTINSKWARRAAQEFLGVEAIEIPGGHCPYLSRPSYLASILNRLANC
ncbi:alpha/beta hydrolase [Leptolyngbya sp. FACHB-671]|nr:alpha/beta hydrolase [Leptolyngbya sp. FACHB-671]MBD2066151.1 alpha/beta hydrolase [Leptolyngbya sp. FACHB-671]